MISAYKFEVRCHVAPRKDFAGFWRAKQFWPEGISTNTVIVVRASTLQAEATRLEAAQALRDGAILESDLEGLLSDKMLGAQVVSRAKVTLTPKVKPVQRAVSVLDELDDEEATRPATGPAKK